MRPLLGTAVGFKVEGLLIAVGFIVDGLIVGHVVGTAVGMTNSSMDPARNAIERCYLPRIWTTKYRITLIPIKV